MRHAQLGDLGDFKNGVNFKRDQMGRGVPLINVKDITGSHRIQVDNLDLVEIEANDEMFAREGDLFFVRSSVKLDGIALCAILMPSDRKAMHCGFAIRFRPTSDELCTDYLLDLLRSQEYRERLKSLSGGAAIVNITQGALKGLRIRIPWLPQQIRIASILSAYDDLIENNRRRIQLLEQAARLLYKEWFVRLRFPGHEHVAITDGIPEGWEKSTVAEVCTAFEDGDWIESKDQGGEDYRLLQISNIGDNEFVETGNFRYITAETFRKLRCNEVFPGDTLISRMPRPIGRAWFVYEQPWRMITAFDVTIARPNRDIVDPFCYLYHLSSPTHIARCEIRATGATRPRISRKNMGALPILKPPMSLQRNFGETASAIGAQRNAPTRQNEMLAQARDLLLPRLMNGELTV